MIFLVNLVEGQGAIDLDEIVAIIPDTTMSATNWDQNPPSSAGDPRNPIGPMGFRRPPKPRSIIITSTMPEGLTVNGSSEELIGRWMADLETQEQENSGTEFEPTEDTVFWLSYFLCLVSGQDTAVSNSRAERSVKFFNERWEEVDEAE